MLFNSFEYLIFLSTVVDYIIGLNIPKQDSEKNKKLLEGKLNIQMS